MKYNPAPHEQSPRPTQSAFTLVELLIVIGIIALLLAVLLPALSKARQAARDTLCANNLRQLAAASIMYRDQYRYFPCCGLTAKNSAALKICPAPTAVNMAMLNSTGPFLYPNWIPVPFTGTTSNYPVGVDNPLPAANCPVAEPFCAGCILPNIYACPDYLADTPSLITVTSANPYYYYSTGYAYFGQIDKPKVPSDGKFYSIWGTVVHPEDVAQASGSGTPGILWSDQFVYAASATTWTYSHSKSISGVRQPRGIHVSFSDGSVVWQNADLPMLNNLAANLGGVTTPAAAGTMCSYATYVGYPSGAGPNGGGYGNTYYFCGTLQRY